MGLFDNKEKKIIEELRNKSKDINNDITKEIDELLDELKSDYNENSKVVSEFSAFVDELKTKLNPDDVNKLVDFTSKLSKVKHCARKGVEAMRELSRDHKKASRETLREYEEYFYMR